tara:strand:- start:547 stop:828 length:282 start_codon:yes stop_codon:yes gene_type:complete
MTQSFIKPVSSKYGAPMGRHTGPYHIDTSAKVYLRKIPLDSGGYDKGGAYWGLGQPLYEAIDHEGNGFIFRAGNRGEARCHVLQDWPEATFYR